jgi:hypothetical protein
VNVDQSANGYDEVLFNGGDTGIPGYTLTLGGGSWFAYVSDGVERHAAFGTEGSLLGHWNQLTAVVDRAAAMLDVYVNGAYVNQVSIAAMMAVDSTFPFQIGSTSSSYTFQGIVDEMRLAKTALGADRIAAEYRNLAMRPAFQMFAAEETF